MKKLFKVNLNNNYYYVYNINNKEHDGSFNTWWIYFSNDYFIDDKTPPIDSNCWIPYSEHINKDCWDIRIKQRNITKYKWDNIRFNTDIDISMYCNSKLIYRFNCNKFDYAFAKIQYLQVELSEHPYNFFEPETEIGSKIYWHGLPAKIKPNESSPWEIFVIPDYCEGYDKGGWWAELKNRTKHMFNTDRTFEDYYVDEIEGDMINWGSALSDQNITWLRD